MGVRSPSCPRNPANTLANELMEPIGTCIYGRRMYEMMTYWDTPEAIDEGSGIEYDFAMTWRAADKIVYSRTLAEVSTARTRLEREFRPDDIRKLKAEATGDIEIGGPTLAAAALHAGLVDQFALFTVPVVHAEWASFLTWLRTGPGQLVGLSLDTDHDYRGARYQAPTFLLTGNEAQGMPESYAAGCDLLVKIPMLGKADSLNAAVATAVMAYEVLNQFRRA